MADYAATWDIRPDIGRHSIGNGIALVTRYFPTYHHWKAIVDGPDALIRDLDGCEFTYDSEEAARDGHADLMRRVNAWYFASEAA